MKLLLFWMSLAACAQAASPHKEAVSFSYTGDVGFGNSVFVLGDHPDVGDGDVRQAIKLRFGAGNVWSGQIAIEAGTQLQYRFLSRANSNTLRCDSANAVSLTGDLFRAIPPQPAAPYSGKTVYYLSGWNPPHLLYNDNGAFVSRPLARAGDGRNAGESLYKIAGVGEAGVELEFVFTDGQGNFDNPPGGGNYLTSLDVFQVQDGNVFSYRPPATVSPPQILTQFVASTAPNIPGRNVRVYLPRGYAQNTTRRYPVLYLHDGQNVFDPGGAFGSWSADATATREIGQGRMREAILVAVDNSSARIPEFMPPTDSYQGTQGRGDAYASFVIHNVRPYVDTSFRTLADARNTMILGSSLGGLISLYFGREFATFGKIGVFSPAFWIAPNYVSQVSAGTKKPLRVYLDFGTSEPSSDWNNALAMYDAHLAQGYAANGDLAFVAGCGQGHNEAAWAARLPGALRYLLPVREEPAELTQREHPGSLVIAEALMPVRSIDFRYSSLFGFSYTLERSPNLLDWSPVSTAAPESFPWSSRSIGESQFPAGDRYFWRVRAIPAP